MITSVSFAIAPRRLRRVAWLMVALWTLALAASVAWNVRLLRETMLQVATQEARTSCSKDLHYLMNPAYMTRQVHAMKAQADDIIGHITSLKPLRPENAPDAWEAAALQTIQPGETEVISRELLHGRRFLRYLKPLVTTAACLECHADQGYKAGERNGGISVAVPLDPYMALAQAELWPIAGGHIGLWALGVLGIGWGARQMRQRFDQQLQATAALRASEDRFRTVADFTADMEYWRLPDGSLAYMSPSCERLTGYSVAEFLQAPELLARIVHPEDRPRIEGHWHDAAETAAGPEHCELEFRILTRSGEARWIGHVCQPVVDREGKFQGRRASNRDLTERKLAEAALRESEERFRNLLRDVPGVAVQGYRMDGTTTYWNQASEVLYGYTAQDALGRNLIDLVIPPEMREGVRQAIRQMAETGQPIPASDLLLMRQDGSRVAVFSSHVIVQIPGRAVELFCLDIDLTERQRAEAALRQSEEQLRSLFENAPVGIFHSTPEGRLLTVNPVLAALLGYASPEALIAATTDMTTQIYADPTLRPLIVETLLKADGWIHYDDVIWQRKDGSLITVDMTGRKVLNAAGGIAYLEGFVEDITERQRAAAALRAASLYARKLIETSLDPLVTISAAGIVTDVNAATEKITGASRERLIGSDFADYFTEPERARAGYQEAFAQGQVIDYPLALRHSSGAITDVLYNAAVYRNEQGEVLGVFAAARDITKRKQVEEEVKRKNASLTLLHQISHALNILSSAAEIPGRVSDLISQVFDNRNLYIALFNETANMVSFPVYRMAGEDQPSLSERPFGNGLTEYVIRTRTPLLISDRLEEALAERGIAFIGALSRCYLGVPMLLNGRVIGVIAVQDYERENVYDVSHVELLSTIAADAAIALSNARLHESLQKELAEHQRTETALRESEEKFRSLFDTAEGAILLLADARFVDCNAKALSIFGGTREQLIGALPSQFSPPIQPDGRSSQEKAIEKINLALTVGPQVFEWEHCRADGTPFAAEVSLNRLDLDGKPQLQAIVYDITERKLAEAALRESEDRFRGVVEGAAMPIFVSLEMKFSYLNPAALRLLGATTPEQVLGQPVLSRIHPDCHDSIQKRAVKVFQGQRGVAPPQAEIYLKLDGTPVPVEATASPITYQGQPAAVVFVQDITERKRLEADNTRLEAQFRQAQKLEAIGQLAGGIAHDFNNILAVILGNVQLAVADTDPNHPASESLKQIKKAGVRAKDLVQQILTYSRQQPQDRHVIPLDPIIAEAAKFLHATIPSGVEIILDLAASAPPVLAEATQIHQVIFNLCTNAWHALEDQPGRITIQLRTVTLDAAAAERFAGLRPGRFACLSISDTGKGMDAATLERIFNPFFTTKAPGKGTGLGLSVVQGIVAAHDGAITVVSQPGQGTTFQVYFPAAFARTDDSGIAPGGPVPQGQGQHVLFLDDEGALVNLATRTLEPLGYRVTGFTQAAVAMQAFRANPGQFDVVITDLNMPGISGLDVARDLLTVRSDVPILLCSGHVTEQMQGQALSAGIRHVLYKPTTLEELSATLHHLFIQPRQPGPNL